MLPRRIPPPGRAIPLAAALLVALAAAACGITAPDAAPPPLPDASTVLVRSDDAITLPLRIDRDTRDVPDYDRDEWRHWLDDDGDCQDARQETLIAEADGPLTYETAERCRVETGRWVDPYTLEVFQDPSDMDVDHVVPLANAHRSGGWTWSRERKAAYANDLDFQGHLVAVAPSANRSKGSRGPEDWRPPNEDYWCDYATDWLKIKDKWELTATDREWIALREMLDTCEEDVHVDIISRAVLYVPSPLMGEG